MKNIFKFVLLIFLANTHFLYAKNYEGQLSTIIKNTYNKTLVSLNKSILNNLENESFIYIHLNKNKVIKFTKEDFERNLNGSIRWKGINKNENANVLLTYFDGILMGQIRHRLNIYKIYQEEDNRYFIEKKDLSKIRKFEGNIKKNNTINTFSGYNLRQIKSKMLSNNLENLDLNIVNGKLQLNIVILYTKKYYETYKNTVNVRLQHSIDAGNDVFKNSKIDIKLNLVHSQVLDDEYLAEDTSIFSALTSLSVNEKAMQLKRKYKAHFLSLFRIMPEDSGVCGLANALDSIEQKYSHFYGLSIVQEDCGDNYTLIHELGHNFGCFHDKDNAGETPPIFKYAYGYDNEGFFATIMSYKSPLIPYFSNPNLTYDGYKIGNENSADNTRTINETKYYIANQFNEKLETTDKFENNTLKGIISHINDKDAFKLDLEGNVRFKMTQDSFLNIYNTEGKKILEIYAEQEINHNFKKDKYLLVVSFDPSQTNWNGNIAYNINLTGSSITNPTTKIDTDNDGIINEKDLDDDNDGIEDTDELKYGLNPLDKTDALKDKDNDGISNIDEIKQGTNPNDKYSKISTINLNQGWNLISLPLGGNINLSSLNNGDILYIETLQNNIWKTWTKNSSSNTLDKLEDGYGYWVRCSQNTSISFKANTRASKKTINPKQWNMFGSYEINDMNKFFKANPSIKIIWKYTNGAYQAISNDSDMTNDLDAQNIPRITNVKANEGFFTK